MGYPQMYFNRLTQRIKYRAEGCYCEGVGNYKGNKMDVRMKDHQLKSGVLNVCGYT